LEKSVMADRNVQGRSGQKQPNLRRSVIFRTLSTV
jgi:hypothetical protein